MKLAENLSKQNNLSHSQRRSFLQLSSVGHDEFSLRSTLHCDDKMAALRRTLKEVSLQRTELRCPTKCEIFFLYVFERNICKEHSVLQPVQSNSTPEACHISVFFLVSTIRICSYAIYSIMNSSERPDDYV